jgi:hypothetical protein
MMLEQARQALAETEQRISVLEAERRDLLLTDDAGRLSRVDAKLDAARRYLLAVREYRAGFKVNNILTPLQLVF